MKTLLEIDKIMQTIPEDWRKRWCGGENGPCGCLGCVQIGNRLCMTGLKATQVDPEYIREDGIPKDVYESLKISKPEWEMWMKMHAANQKNLGS